MNIALEMDRMCDRFEELLNYAEEKQARAAERKESMGVTIDKQRKAKRAEVQKIHDEEAEERMRDQQQHKAQPDVDYPEDSEHVISDEEALATLEASTQ